jgi:Spy/CpxP family protein refolding chaperone
MFILKIIHLIVLAATLALFCTQNVLALTAIDSIGTGSSGTYNHGERKDQGSKNKKITHHISGSEGHHISGNRPHYKSEGSGSKKLYSHNGGKSYSHKKSEGSQLKSYSHGKYGHGKTSHTYKSGYGKSHGHKKRSHGRHGKSPFEHVMDYKHKLGFTDAQVRRMKQLDLDFKKKIIQAKADHEIAHMELDLQVHSGKVDEVKIRAAGEKIVASKTNKIIAMIDAKIQLLNLLTADQRNKIAKMH